MDIPQNTKSMFSIIYPIDASSISVVSIFKSFRSSTILTPSLSIELIVTNTLKCLFCEAASFNASYTTCDFPIVKTLQPSVTKSTACLAITSRLHSSFLRNDWPRLVIIFFTSCIVNLSTFGDEIVKIKHMNNSQELAIDVIGLPLFFSTPIADLIVFTSSCIVLTV